MQYGLQVWGQKQSSTLNQIERLQNKNVKIMPFKSKYYAVNPAYTKWKILNIRDMLTLSNCQFVQDRINGQLIRLREEEINIILILEAVRKVK